MSMDPVIEIIEAERTRQGWTCNDLAEESDVAHNTYSRMRLGHNVPRLSTIRALLDTLGLGLEIKRLHGPSLD